MHPKSFKYHSRRGGTGDALGDATGEAAGPRGLRHAEGGGRGHHGRGSRVFGHGGLRFVLLKLLDEQPSHGYELIKHIEDRLGGAYSPSPGTVYPTLTMLEEQGFLTVDEADAGGRKRYRTTKAGRDHLEANRETVDALLARMARGGGGPGGRGGRPPQVMRAIENLKLAIRMRLAGEPLTPQQASAFAAVLDHAAQQLEQV